MKLYHATDFDNLGKILAEGLKPSAGVIYLAESYDETLSRH
nr:MAG TPA: ssDNA thymidine ADP-ribosyltransferase, DarT [Caudoviricetes sp.]